MKDTSVTINENAYLKVVLSELPLAKDLRWIPYYFDGDEVKKFDSDAIQKIVKQALLKDMLELIDYNTHFGCDANDEEFIVGDDPKDLCCDCYPHKSCVLAPKIEKFRTQLRQEITNYFNGEEVL